MANGAVYYSKSRKALVLLEEMPTTHLANAAKKLARDGMCTDIPGESAQAQEDHALGGAEGVLVEMIDELASRVPPAGS